MVIRLDRTAEVLRELNFLAHHEVRVGVLTGPNDSGGSAGDAAHVGAAKLTGSALRAHKIWILSRRFRRQDVRDKRAAGRARTHAKRVIARKAKRAEKSRVKRYNKRQRVLRARFKAKP